MIPAISRTLERFGIDPKECDEGTYALTLGIDPGSGAATILAFLRTTLLDAHYRATRTSNWPTDGLSSLEVALKTHLRKQFYWAGRKTVHPAADKKRRKRFDLAWCEHELQEGILETDWGINTLEWTWNLTR